MAQEPIKLQDQDVYEVAFVESGLKYKTGQRNKEGKTFTRYQRNGIAFSVPTDHPFNADFASGKVKSITLIPGTATVERTDAEGVVTKVDVDTLNFTSYINKEQWNSLREERLADAKVDAQIKRLNNFAAADLNGDVMDKLMNVAPLAEA